MNLRGPRLLAVSTWGAGLAVALGLTCGKAAAASARWNGSTDSNWATAANWSAAPVPGTGDTATFGMENNGRTNISLGAGVTIQTIVFDSNLSGYAIGDGGGGNLTLNHSGAVTITNAADQRDATIHASVILGTTAGAADYTFSNSCAGTTLTIAGGIAGGTGGAAGAKTVKVSAGGGSVVIGGILGGGGGTIGLTKSGSSTLTLSGANTFTGPLTVSEGVLSVPAVNNASAAGPLGSSTNAVSIGFGGALLCTYTGAPSAVSSTKKFTMAGDGVFFIESPTNELRLSGIVGGSGALEKAGPGTLVLSNSANSYAGSTVTAGTLKVSGSGRLGATNGYLHMNGGILDLGGTDQTVGAFWGGGGTILNSGSGESLLTVSVSTFANNFHGVIADTTDGGTGTVALRNIGTGDLILHGTNTYSGPTTVGANATITIVDAGTLGNTVAGTTVTSGGTLSLHRSGSCSEAVTLAGTGSGSGAGAALTGYDSTYAGLLKLTADSTVSTDWGEGETNSFHITNPGTITGSGFDLTLNNTDATERGTLASSIGTGSGKLIKTGPGVWTITGASTYTGTTTVSNGILNIQNSTALGATSGGTTVATNSTLQIEGAAGSVTVGAEALGLSGAGAEGTTGALQSLYGSNSYGGAVTLNADATIAVDSGSLNMTNGISCGTRLLTLTGGGAGTVAGVVSGSGTVTKSGAGSWTLAGTASTYTGRTIIESGMLEIKSLKNVGAGSSYYSSLGAPTNVANGTIDLGSTFTSATLRFTGTTNATSNRVLNLAGDFSDVTLDSSGATNAKLVLTSALTVTGWGNHALTLAGSSAGDNEIGGTIPDGSGGFTFVVKSGPGKWILSGTNTYSGDTAVYGGSLTFTRAGLADAAGVWITSGTTLDLAFSGSDAVGYLRIDGAPQSPGTWGGPASAATYKTSLISGTGMLLVGSGPAQPPYASWAAGYGLVGEDAASSADPEHDGIANGMEWILGGSPVVSDLGVLPRTSFMSGDFVLTFDRNDASESAGVQLVAQWDTGLASWTNEVPITASSGSYPPDIYVSVDENGSAPDTIMLQVPPWIGDRFFVRLKATMP